MAINMSDTIGILGIALVSIALRSDEEHATAWRDTLADMIFTELEEDTTEDLYHRTTCCANRFMSWAFNVEPGDDQNGLQS